MKKYLRIITLPNTKLRQKSVDIKFPISTEIKMLINNMKSLVIDSHNEEIAKKYKLTPAVGIAAVQVNSLYNLFYVYSKKLKLEDVIINPVIIEKSLQMCYLEGGEGCLSLKKNHSGYTLRHHKISIKAFEFNSKLWKTYDLLGHSSIIFQHEYDHLLGKLYIDNLIPFNDPLNLLQKAIKI